VTEAPLIEIKLLLIDSLPGVMDDAPSLPGDIDSIPSLLGVIDDTPSNS
jgi:hypothetical protein